MRTLINIGMMVYAMTPMIKSTLNGQAILGGLLWIYGIVSIADNKETDTTNKAFRKMWGVRIMVIGVWIVLINMYNDVSIPMIAILSGFMVYNIVYEYKTNAVFRTNYHNEYEE